LTLPNVGNCESLLNLAEAAFYCEEQIKVKKNSPVLLKEMSFLEQPNDMLIEQLSRLSLRDLMNACQSHRQIAQLCQTNQFWNGLIINRAPQTNLREIQNPQAYYLDNLLEDVSIYDHNQEKSELIYRDDVFLSNIAYEYAAPQVMIVYSRALVHEGRLRLVPIAFHSENRFIVLPNKSQHMINQVDILHSVDPEHNMAMLLLSLAEQVEALPRGQQLEVTMPDGTTHLLGRRELNQARSSLRKLAHKITRLHRKNNTPLLQQLINPQIEANLSALVLSPPQQNPREQIYNQIVSNFSQSRFNSGDDGFLGFRSYQEFLNFQRDYIQNLNDAQLQTVQMLYQVLPISKIFDENHGSMGRLAQVVVFDSVGHLVFVFVLPR